MVVSKRNIFLVTLFFLVLLSINFISAPPPTEIGFFPEGFSIEYPNDQNIQQHQNYEFQFHVFNSSNGVPIITGVSCYFHLFNSSGNHILILQENVPSTNFDYSFQVNGGNFSQIGELSYIITCNSSTQGGFDDVAFDITPDGNDHTTGDSLLYSLFIIIFFGILSVLIYLIIITPGANERDGDGEVIGIVKLKYLRILLIGITYPLVILLLNLMTGLATIVTNFPILSNTLGILFEIMLRVAWPFTVVLIVWTIILLIKDSNFKRIIKRMGGLGGMMNG